MVLLGRDTFVEIKLRKAKLKNPDFYRFIMGTLPGFFRLIDSFPFLRSFSNSSDVFLSGLWIKNINIKPLPIQILSKNLIIGSMRFKIILEEDEDVGGFIASCSGLPGCFSQGDTVEEAIENIKEAIQVCLESLAEYELHKPF